MSSSPFICQYTVVTMICRMAFLVLALAVSASAADFDVRANYLKTEYQIPMRDGVKLFAAVYTPRSFAGKLPILMTRTPYGIAPYGTENYPKHIAPLGFAEEAFIFVLEDVRGRFMSEGTFVDVRPIKEVLENSDTDESTDTFDTIGWLLKHLPDNNGKVGLMGTSYAGYYTSCGLVRSHPALVAASPQAPMADLYRGDDAYHNGAFFLVANFSFYTAFNKQNNPLKPSPPAAFDYGSTDGYKFYLQMGPLANSDKLYLLNQNPYWTDMYTHTTEDSFWRVRNILPHLRAITPAVLVVGGWYDAEDLAGTLKTYQAIRRQSPSTNVKLAMGPWSHGGWNFQSGEKLGDITFGAHTAETFRDLELRFFRQYLKDAGPAGAPEAFMFETGTNEWKSLPEWPPADTSIQKLYLQPRGKLAFRAPSEPGAFDEYVSDPADPVPFLAAPSLDMVKEYMVGDQRFLSDRKDVLTYLMDPLTEDLVVAGPISPNLFVSTSATDSDFDVKLIDVLPDGYEQLVRGEPFRGKFRRGFQTGVSFKPNVPEQVRFTMPDVYHCFRKGHRVMVQIQSSWFPLTDVNPQTFTEIPTAKPDDFVKAVERIYHSRQASSYIELPVERR